MTIELWDMDLPYELQMDANDEGKDIVKIVPRTDMNEQAEEFTICLDANMCRELARCLNFMAKEISR